MLSHRVALATVEDSRACKIEAVLSLQAQATKNESSQPADVQQHAGGTDSVSIAFLHSFIALIPAAMLMTLLGAIASFKTCSNLVQCERYGKAPDVMLVKELSFHALQSRQLPPKMNYNPTPPAAIMFWLIFIDRAFEAGLSMVLQGLCPD